MTNKEIARNLVQIAKILELKGKEKDRFRVIAYERAAAAIENLGEDVVTIYSRSKYSSGGLAALNEIEGVGESIAEKIEELIKTGKLKYLDEIQGNIPEAEVELLKVPGIGPKMAVKLTQKLKAKSVADLEKKIKRGLADKFLGEKTKAKLLKGIEVLGKLTGRMLITDALPIAQSMTSAIRKMPQVGKADYVGSLRRYKETIGDIDIVATAKAPEKVIAQFTRLPEVAEIINQGKTKSTILHRQGVQVDLEIVPPAEYGSLLQHFTGSKEHNVALRIFAQTKGKSVSEHGIKIGKKQYKFSEEKAVYEFLGLDYIEPELREDWGEIGAALKHRLPKLAEEKDIKGDLHVHSNWSDGKMTIGEIAALGKKFGYEYIVVSDHTVGLGIAHGLDEKALLARQKEIDEVQKKHKIKIFSSVEVNIKADATLDIRQEMLDKLDIVTASVHSSFNQSKETMTKRLLAAIADPRVDIIGHPSGRIIGQREPYEADWPAIFKACAKYHTALEISAFPNRLDLKDSFCKEAKGYGVKFAVNTDAHQPHHLALMRFGVAVARRGWLEKSDIINTMSVKDLQQWIGQK